MRIKSSASARPSSRAKKDVWNGGRVYDPTKGKSYKAEVSFGDAQTLRIKGSLLGFSRSVYWTKTE